MNPRQLTLTAAALLVSAAGASAATITQTLTIGPSLKPISATQTFSQFNVSGQTLTKVTDTLIETFTEKFSVTNTGSVSASTGVLVTETQSKSFALAGLTVSGTDSGSTSTGLLAPSTGSATGSFTGGDTNSASVTAAAALAAFTGTGTISATLTDSGVLGTTGNIQVAILSSDVATLVDKLQYFTTSPPPPPAVPEPATLTLLGSGLIGLGLARMARRRRR